MVHPYRERLVALLMLALYRSNRQADALAAYRTTRIRFSEELGIDPSTTLQDLEIGILRQDPALELPHQPHPSSIGASADNDRRVRVRPASILRGRRLLLFLGAAALVGVTGLLVATRPSTDVRPAAGSLTTIDARSLQITASTLVGEGPGLVAAGESAVWVANERDHTIVSMDIATGRTTVRGIPAVPTSLAVGSNAVWAGLGHTGSFVRISTDGNDVVGPYEAGEGATGRASLAGVHETLWIGLRDGTLRRFGPGDAAPVVVADGLGDAEAIAAKDVRSGGSRIRNQSSTGSHPAATRNVHPSRRTYGHCAARRVGLGGVSGLSHLAARPGSGDGADGVALPYPATALAASDTALWVACADGKAIFRVNWADLAVDMIRFEFAPSGIAVVGDQVFISLR